MAENSRSPAVLDGSCDLNISTTTTEIIKGRSVEIEKPISQAQKELCLEVRKCMNSAEEEKMPSLKNLEAVACSNTMMKSVTIKNPASILEPGFNGRRDAKDLETPVTETKIPENNTTTR